jgi:hypothetical protein
MNPVVKFSLDQSIRAKVQQQKTKKKGKKRDFEIIPQG